MERRTAFTRRGGGWAGWSAGTLDACVALGWGVSLTTRTRATQASPPLIPTTPAPTSKHYHSLLLILGRSTIEKVLCRILHQDLGLVVCLVAASYRRFPSIRIEPLNMSDPAHQATSLRRFRFEQKPINAIGIWSWSTCHFFAHNFAAVQGLPGGPCEMDNNKIPFISVAFEQDCVRYRPCERSW